MQGRRMCKKLLIMLMCMCVLVAGCSKKPSAAKPLKSMTIGQVRQLVLNWGYGKLPEQQVEGADEIRKELEVLEKELTEQEAKDKNRGIALDKQKSDLRKRISHIRSQTRDQLQAEYRRSQMSHEEWKKLEKTRLEEEERILKEPKEQLRRAQEEYTRLYTHHQLILERNAFAKANITPLRKQLEPDKSVKTFYKVFGKPKDKSLIGDNYYLHYRCKDGIVLLEINAHYFDNDKVLIQSVSVL